MEQNPSKKRKVGDDVATKPKVDKGKKSSDTSSVQNGGTIPIQHISMTLDEIRASIKKLCQKVPTVPEEGLDPEDSSAVTSWAKKMQAVVEELNLLLSCVATATYKWGTDRSGAADQNLSMLSGELSNAQEQISSSVSPRLSNVLAPVVDLVESKAIEIIDKESGKKITTKEYKREIVDIVFHQMCTDTLCRNAKMLRFVVLTNFHKIDKVILDYEKATKKDSHHDRSLAF